MKKKTMSTTASAIAAGKKISIRTKVTSMMADMFTPVGIYLRLRDHFRDTILLESTDSHAAENSYSFICINAIAGIEISNRQTLEFKLPLQEAKKISLGKAVNLQEVLCSFMQKFDTELLVTKEARFAQGLYGYFAYDAVPLFEHIEVGGKEGQGAIPIARYRLYQYVIAINHYKDELLLLENELPGLESDAAAIKALIQSRNVPVYPFEALGEESSNMDDETYRQMVRKGIEHCHRGDVFQIVLSRRFQQSFRGDEFNVYRALRHINPSPYLFFFDYGDYKLMGSSPESQIIITKGKAVVHPIAGTFRRSGNDLQDEQKAKELLADPKENAEHVMLVDLARNDLSRVTDEVQVTSFKQIQFYSHVIHMVSEVQGRVKEGTNPFSVLFNTFPAGTLSGAPKYKAMQLIEALEPTARSFYGGAIGFVGFNGDCNHAIMIRTFLSRNNTLTCQAGAGVVAVSQPESELQEVANKLNALRQAIIKANELR
jgi:anthranilate synthase component I